MDFAPAQSAEAPQWDTIATLDFIKSNKELQDSSFDILQDMMNFWILFFSTIHFHNT